MSKKKFWGAICAHIFLMTRESINTHFLHPKKSGEISVLGCKKCYLVFALFFNNFCRTAWYKIALWNIVFHIFLGERQKMHIKRETS